MPNEAINLPVCKERDPMREYIKNACDRMRQAEDDGDEEEMLRQATRIVSLAQNLKAHAEAMGL
jgi:hypothetical protein